MSILSMFGAAGEAAQVKAQVTKYKSGATEDQKDAIDYFIPNGGALFNFFNAMTLGLVGLIYSMFFEKEKDKEYEQIVERLLASQDTYHRALDKIGLDESQLQEIEPVKFCGYDDSDFVKFTVKGEYRTNKIMVAHLFFSDTQVYLYKIIFDTMKNDVYECNEECYYSDIVKLRSVVNTKEHFKRKGCLKAKWKRIPYQIQRFELFVPGTSFACCTDGDISKQVEAMTFKVREKKTN